MFVKTTKFSDELSLQHQEPSGDEAEGRKIGGEGVSKRTNFQSPRVEKVTKKESREARRRESDKVQGWPLGALFNVSNYKQ